MFVESFTAGRKVHGFSFRFFIWFVIVSGA